MKYNDSPKAIKNSSFTEIGKHVSVSICVAARPRDKAAYEARRRSRGTELSGSNVFVTYFS